MKRYSYLLILFLCCQIVTAQTPTPTKSDSIYKKIDTYSENKSFFKFIHKYIFRTPEDNKKPKKIDNIEKIKISPLQKSYNRYESKIIRNINIETLDPLGFSLEDTTSKPKNRAERIVNTLHIKSKKWAIKNLLLFKQNQPVDSLLINESKRIIRSQRYISGVEVELLPIANEKDSVDVSVRVLDTWSIIPTGAFSNSKGNLDITDRNIIGFGHELDLNYIKSFTTSDFGYNSKYSVNNIKNSFVNTSVSSATDLNQNNTKIFTINRPFYSTTARWASGFQYTYNNRNEFLTSIDSIQSVQNSTTKTYDIWGAYSFKIFKGKSEFARATNFIVSSGFTTVNYLSKPDIIFDPINYYNSSRTVLGSFGLASQRFYQDKYIFRFGTIEDIPYGKLISFTAGSENKNFINRPYVGGRFSFGDFYSFGYLAFNLEYGTFFNHSKSEQTALKIEANYFSQLFAMGKWKFRQFIKPVVVLGKNRLDTPKDRLNLITDIGIPGFVDSPLVGTKKMITTFQTQSYAPNNWYGFNFSPFLNLTLGFLGDEKDKILNPKMYSQLGVGVLINNKYLVFSSFQLSFSYYPTLPLDGSNLIKTNAFQNSDIQFSTFQIARPYVLPYQ